MQNFLIQRPALCQLYCKPESLPWKYHADSKPETKYNNQLQKFSKNQLHELILQYFELIQLHVPDYAIWLSFVVNSISLTFKERNGGNKTSFSS